MIKLTEVIQSSSEMQNDKRVENIIAKLFASLLKCQRIYLEILECPQGRILDCLVAVSG